jgi:hypothetical protein
MTDGQQLALSRRGFLRAATAGAAAAAVTGLAVAGGRPARAVDYSLQVYWGHCVLCGEIFFAGSGFKGQGVCPAQPGDGHALGSSWKYSAVYNQGTTSGLPGTPGYQSGWFWCTYCYAMWWPGANPDGCCPAEKGANGQHAKGSSYTYAVPVGESGSSYQPDWQGCKDCGCQYYTLGTQYCWVNGQIGGSGNHVPIGSWPYVWIH